ISRCICSALCPCAGCTSGCCASTVPAMSAITPTDARSRVQSRRVISHLLLRWLLLALYPRCQAVPDTALYPPVLHLPPLLQSQANPARPYPASEGCPS